MSKPPVTCTRRIEWDSAHRVLKHESKCATLHGHRYVALVSCEADELDGVGRVVDFGVVKSEVGGWVDAYWDHTTLVNGADRDLLAFCQGQQHLSGNRPPFIVDGEPTAENIAAALLDVAQGLLGCYGVRVSKVEVFETPNCSATAFNPRKRVR